MIKEKKPIEVIEDLFQDYRKKFDVEEPHRLLDIVEGEFLVDLEEHLKSIEGGDSID